MRICQNYIAALLCILCSSSTKAQITCPPNLDFEMGGFDNWQMAWGQVSNTNGPNEINWLGNTQDPSRHQIINRYDNSTDRYGGFPRLCPNGSGFSVMLGNDGVGGQAEMISYEFEVPSNATDYSIFFHYAVVLEDPSHNTEQQPRFRARLINAADDSPINCVNFDFTANGGIPGFEESQVKPGVLFKDWTPVTLNLTPFAGSRIRLEFITSDCTLMGHFGYAYIDVSSVCTSTISGSTVCLGDPSGILSAPSGFLGYVWYSDASFSTIISTQQQLVLSPPPAAGSSYPVILIPYSGFGCLDTVYATISTAPKPPVFAGANRSICTYESTRLGSPPDPGLKYSWEPAEKLVDPGVSQPMTVPHLTATTIFTLTVTDPSTGCKSMDNVVVDPLNIDTALVLSGDLIYCKADIQNTSLTLTGPADGVRWFANGQFTGATGSQYDPRATVSTDYFAEITYRGCKDSSRVVGIKIAPDPVAAFEPERKVQCVQIPLTFFNRSRIQGDEDLDYRWRLQDGTEITSTDLVVRYAGAGIQPIMLTAISQFGCENSITRNFDIVENCHVNVPNGFTPNGDQLNDIFKPALNGIKALRRFAIFDRWGRIVYSTNRFDEGWDGKQGGVLMDAGVYAWMVEYDSFEQNNIVIKGTVTLIR
jgi:gliding motility-associated-like protein